MSEFVGSDVLKVLERAEKLLRTRVQPTLETIGCVTDLQAVIHRLKRAKKAGTI